MARQFKNTIQLSIDSLRSSRLRSFLTMSGVIISVASVIVAAGVGRGVINDINRQLNVLGDDVALVQSGAASSSGSLSETLKTLGSAQPSLTLDDVEKVSTLASVQAVAPIIQTKRDLGFDQTTTENQLVVVSDITLRRFLFDQIAHGVYASDNSEVPGVVIGKRVAENVFGENVPLGKTFDLGGQRYIVKGVLKDYPFALLSLLPDFDNAVIVGIDTIELNTSERTFAQMLLSTNDQSMVSMVRNELNKPVTVITQDNLADTVQPLVSRIAVMVVIVAGITLLLGSIGIMNVMLAVVTERTKEIGVRKSIGASSRQIGQQFLLETLTTVVVASLLGVLVALIGLILMGLLTPFVPSFMWQAAVVAVGVSVVMGLIFGVAPALSAARKDPIASLRS